MRIRLHGGSLRETTAEEKDIARRYYRFYLALQLRDLCNEVPVHRVARKYDTPRGSVQTLAQTCESFAAGMIKFCEHMDWGFVLKLVRYSVAKCANKVEVRWRLLLTTSRTA